MEKLKLDFYYGREAEQFTFYRLPKALITDARFKGITNNAKLLYGLMLDRMSLSKKRGWLDEANKVFIKYSLNNIEEDLNVSRKNRIFAIRAILWLSTKKKLNQWKKYTSVKILLVKKLHQ